MGSMGNGDRTNANNSSQMTWAPSAASAVGRPSRDLRCFIATLLLCAFGVACSDSATAPGNSNGGGKVPNSTWIAVAAGTYNSCAINASGGTYCWGFDLLAPCSSTGCKVDSVPSLVAGSVEFVSLASGGGFHCGVTAAGAAYCWGQMFVGSLGDGTTTVSATPIRVAIPSPVSEISAGYQHACALTIGGTAYCWGGGGSGELGLGSGVRQTSIPKPVTTSLTFTAISAGTTQTCAITPSATAYCWGGGYGSLGVGSRDTSCAYSDSCLNTDVPLLVDGGLQWTSISAGNGFTCGVTVDRRGYCWGGVLNRGDPNPPLGVLGNGQFTGSKSPVPVSGGLNFRFIATGTRQACGGIEDGTVFCWGDNDLGELGTGTLGGHAAVPQRLTGGLNFSALTLADHSCGLSVNGGVYCWGTNYGGALGTGRTQPFVQLVPTPVASPSG